ncbi:adenylosuccinate synthetase [Archangium lansingense]|uniref:Adenylosuccinate synthetase n=1 Tax=Archangium lansingense TaxID=2995310 RepID=A0ABT4AMN4_9BACT|nr:adenylosuccinate synthetase [Archangium lansinium]MCY1082087.1 adenylosuccinate synthetase [Archangium lansinium]
MKGPRGQRVSIVIDLGFGDCGKGLLTDFLVRQTGANVVVRYNGGAQAGHNVVTPDGRHHTFAQFGAGTFVPGVRTFLSRHVVIHPTALRVEGEALRAKGVGDVFSRIRISERARVITPFHQSANRLRELARGESRHGSCGVGVGETVQDALEHPEETVLAGDLRDAALSRRKLQRIRERKHGEMRALWGASPAGAQAERERAIFEHESVIDAWLEQATHLVKLGLVVPDSMLSAWMKESPATVFEGAQGVLLDEWHGFHPFTTWSNCTAANALALIAESGLDADVERIGVLRSHVARHGAGPLPTETESLRPVLSEHNIHNAWQGNVRYGWFDAVLARYALDVVGGVDALAITHLDLSKRLHTWKVCAGYHQEPMPGDSELIAHRTGAGLVTRLAVSTTPSLERQARLAGWLQRVTPSLEEGDAKEDAVLEHLERLLGRNIDLVSQGPCASDVSFRSQNRPS